MVVLEVAHNRPQCRRGDPKASVKPLLVLQSGNKRMALDVEVGRGRDAVLLVLAVVIARLHRSHIAKKPVGVARTLAVEQSATLLNIN